MSNNKQSDEELECRITSVAERLLQTMSASTQQDPFQIQKRVFEAITEAVNNKLQPLVADMIRSVQRKKDTQTDMPGTSKGRCAFPHLG